MHYEDLTNDAKAKIWINFMKKARDDAATQTSPTAGLTEEQLKFLKKRNVNGRQIKNAVRTAGALASSMQEELGYRHLESVLEMMAEFEAEMNAAAREEDL